MQKRQKQGVTWLTYEEERRRQAGRSGEERRPEERRADVEGGGDREERESDSQGIRTLIPFVQSCVDISSRSAEGKRRATTAVTSRGQQGPPPALSR